MRGSRAAALAVLLVIGSGLPARAFVPPPFGKRVVVQLWAGEWSTSYGPMLLAQKGKVVVGHYVYSTPPVTGEIRGEAEGHTLTFTWEEGKGGAGAGGGTFELDADGQSFKGTWTVGSSTTVAGTWEGTRIKP